MAFQMTTGKQKKKLQAIELSLENARQIDNVELERAALRLALKLRIEFDYVLDTFDHVCINLISSIPEGEIRPWKFRTETWRQTFDYGITADELLLLSDITATEIIAKVLWHLAIDAGSDTEPIQAAVREILATGMDTTIQLVSKRKRSRDYLIEPFFKVRGYAGNTLQLFATVTDLRAQRRGTLMLAETNAYEALSLAGTFVIKGENLVVRPKQGVWAEIYRSRGFRVPIQVPLDVVCGS